VVQELWKLPSTRTQKNFLNFFSLGSYLANKTSEEVEEAFALLSIGNENYKFEYLNTGASLKVIQRFGLPKDGSIGFF
jgi:hypothetical protein